MKPDLKKYGIPLSNEMLEDIETYIERREKERHGSNYSFREFLIEAIETKLQEVKNENH